MHYSLRLIFEGLCAFVPVRALQQGENSTDLWVLLVNADKPGSKGGRVREIHYPRLIVDSRSVHGLTGFLGLELWWDLSRREVRLQLPDDVKPHPVSFYYTPGLAGKPDGNASDVGWVPRIYDISRRSSYIKRSLIGGSPPEELATRFFLEHGRLSAGDFGQHNEDHVIAQFVPDESGIYKSLPIQVALQIDNLESPVTVVAMNLDADPESVEPEYLELAPAEGEEEEGVIVHVRNSCPDLLLGRSRAPRVMEPVADPDFSWFYELSVSEPVPLHPVPFPIDYRTEALGGEGGGEPVRCTSAWMEK